jgi:hypothetical protein
VHETVVRKGCTYSPLHSVHDESSCAANANPAEEHGNTFIPVSVASNAKGAWSCGLLWLVQKRLRVGRDGMLEVVNLKAGLDHVLEYSVSRCLQKLVCEKIITKREDRNPGGYTCKAATEQNR